jgi:hypothetical protein
VRGDGTWFSFVNVEAREQSKQWMFTHPPDKLKKFEQTSAHQKADGTCFLDQERNADDGIHVTRDHSNVRSVLQNTKKLCGAIQNKRPGMLISSVALLIDIAYLDTSTAAHARALLKHFIWELLNHPPNNPDLALSDYHLFTYLKNWLRSQHFNNNEELMEGVRTWLSSQAADFFDKGIQRLIP